MRLTLPAKYCRSSSDTGVREIHFLYDCHQEHFMIGKPVYDEIVASNLDLMRYFFLRNTRGPVAAFLGEGNPADVAADSCGAKLKALSASDFASIQDFFKGTIFPTSRVFLPYYVYSLFCSEAKNLTLIPSGNLRSDYVGYTQMVIQQLMVLSGKPHSLDFLRDIQCACRSLKAVLSPNHEENLRTLARARETSYLGLHEKTWGWYLNEERLLSEALQHIEKMRLRALIIAHDHPSFEKTLPARMRLRSPDEQERYLVLSLCAINKFFDLKNEGFTDDECTLLRDLAAVCECVNETLQSFYGNFELLFNLGNALEKYDECYVYAGMFHCQDIAKHLENDIGAVLVVSEGFVDSENADELKDRHLPFSSIKWL